MKRSTSQRIREKKLAKAKVEGKDNITAYKEAGYSVTGNKEVDKVNASRAIKRPSVQALINEALEVHGATPEWAVAQLKHVAEQNKELGAKRLASKDILELHGWNKTEKPGLQLDIKNAFFGGARKVDNIIDADQD